MKTFLISAFPATGKSFIAKKYPNLCLDSDSSEYSWLKDSNGNNTSEKNSLFPENYINHIKRNIGKVRYIFISSHEIVRNALVDAKLDFILIYPSIIQKNDYIKRYEERGSPKSFIDLISKNWNDWISQCENQKKCRLIELQPNEFLIDRLMDKDFI